MYKNVCVVLLLMIASSAFASRVVRPVRIQTESEMLGLCEGCHFLVGLVEQEVDGNRQQIEAYLQDVCNIVPATVRPACTQIVGAYSDELITFILNQITPDVACTKLGLCSASPRLTQLLDTPVKTLDQGFCTQCESAVFFVQLYLKSNSTITQVNQLVNQACTSLFPTNPSQCVALAQIGVQYVLSFLSNNSPQTICTDLKLCATVRTLLAEARLRSESGSLCSLCEVVAQWGENELLSVNVENTLVEAVEKVCDLLPAAWSSNCSQLVAGLLPQLLAQLVANYPPNTLCGLASLC